MQPLTTCDCPCSVLLRSMVTPPRAQQVGPASSARRVSRQSELLQVCLPAGCVRAHRSSCAPFVVSRVVWCRLLWAGHRQFSPFRLRSQLDIDTDITLSISISITSPDVSEGQRCDRQSRWAQCNGLARLDHRGVCGRVHSAALPTCSARAEAQATSPRF